MIENKGSSRRKNTKRKDLERKELKRDNLAAPIRYQIVINGIVQGVGFRPFIYRLAVRCGIKGWVKNTPGGVVIDAEGKKAALECFMTKIQEDSPPIARVETVEVDLMPPVGYMSFQIRESEGAEKRFTYLSPDIAVCNNCLQELNDRGNRRYLYPFINCTNCGPRFTIIREMPYDRPLTTMSSFKMCQKCREEYEDPADRRFHAQPTACPDCGPFVWLTDKSGIPVETNGSAIKEAITLLLTGKILAVKGVGGFHLACTAREEVVIDKLRERKERPWKPLAIMVRDISTARRCCKINKDEEAVLKGSLKPILLLKKKELSYNFLPGNLAPVNNYLGVMLPYTPLHSLLFSGRLDIMVMTSGNCHGLPIEYTNQGALDRLSGIADFFLLNNREIEVPVDDPVIRICDQEIKDERIIRTGRGYTPQVFMVDNKKSILACGAYYNNTFCLSHRGKAILSQYMGDISTDEALQRYSQIVNHYKKIFKIEPLLFVHDLHPGYLTSDYAMKQAGKKVAIQHHHAHIASCMAENSLKDTVIGLAFDGTGLGLDGKIWGGEFLLCNYRNFTRVGHLNYISLPGGEKAIEEPWRAAVAFLHKAFNGEYDKILKGLLTANLNREDSIIVLKMLEKEVNCPATSSMGRLFDAVSALIGIREEVSYQGQAAVELETVAACSSTERYRYQLVMEDESHVINSDLIIKGVLSDLNRGERPGVISRRFHNTVIAFSIELTDLIKEKYGIDRVALSGGVFQNRILLEGIRQGLEDRGFAVYTHRLVPCNDGGLSLGQLVIAGGE